MSQAVNLILDKLVANLKAECQTAINSSNLTYAEVVKKGLLQENKVQKNVELAVQGGDHDDPAYQDGIVSLEKFENIAFEVPAREIGGGQLWWRRGVVRIDAFFIREKLTEDEAHEAAYEVLGRVESAIESTNMTGVVDSYDERAIKVFCFGNTFFESGGKPNQFIFRGKVFWSCLTERP